MTNKTVTMPLELAETLAGGATSAGGFFSAMKELRALLAAPPLSDYLASCESAHNGLTIDQAEAVEKGIDDLLFSVTPAVERQEPVAYLIECEYRASTTYSQDTRTERFERSREVSFNGSKRPRSEIVRDVVVAPLYTSPPAPVAVVLPEQKQGVRAWSHDMGGNYEEGHADGWNACLDKVKELNK